MSTPSRTSRPDLLVAMVSADVLVLAKLVHALRPHRVLMFSTLYAERRRWHLAAKELLEHEKGRTVDRYDFFELPDGDEQQITVFGKRLRTVLSDAVRPFRIAYDATTGRGLLRILGFNACRRIVESRDFDMEIVYVDADTGSIVEAGLEQDIPELSRRPIRFNFATDEPLRERFAMVGVRVDSFDRLLAPHGKATARTDMKDDVAWDTVRELYRQLCENCSLRALFNSYWYHAKEWKQAAATGTRDPNDFNWQASIRQAIDETVKNVITALQKRAPVNDAKSTEIGGFVRRELRRTIKRIDGSEGADLKLWTAAYGRDRLDKMKAVITRDTLNKINEAASKLVSGRAKLMVQEILAGACRRFVELLRSSLREIITSHTALHEVGELTADEHQAYVEEVLPDGLPGELRRQLVQGGRKMADWFELAVCAMTVDTITSSDSLRSKVAGVYANVELERDKARAEYDVLVVLHNGGLVVLEAKTHFENADRKKIEANIKTLRDLGGAYSAYTLVFPLVKKEIKDLIDSRNYDKYEEAGMYECQRWHQQLASVRGSRDQQVVGLDEVADFLARETR